MGEFMDIDPTYGLNVCLKLGCIMEYTKKNGHGPLES